MADEDKTKKKVFGKYDSEEEALKGWQELEKKFGDQTTEVGTLRAQAKEMQDYIAQAGPIVKWYGENRDHLARVLAQPTAQAQPQQVNANGIVQHHAQEIAQQTQGYEWLTPQEKVGLQQEIVKHLSEQVVGPWTKNFQTTAEQFAAQIQNQQRAFTDVLWRTFERVLPPDKLQEARKWHEQALQFADPSKLDPMKVAGDFLGIQSENATLKSQVEELNKKVAEREKAEIPSFGNGPSSLTAEAPEAPKSKQERFDRVMADVKTQNGAEGMHALFPSLG